MPKSYKFLLKIIEDRREEFILLHILQFKQKKNACLIVTSVKNHVFTENWTQLFLPVVNHCAIKCWYFDWLAHTSVVRTLAWYSRVSWFESQSRQDSQRPVTWDSWHQVHCNTNTGVISKLTNDDSCREKFGSDTNYIPFFCKWPWVISNLIVNRELRRLRDFRFSTLSMLNRLGLRALFRVMLRRVFITNLCMC